MKKVAIFLAVLMLATGSFAATTAAKAAPAGKGGLVIGIERQIPYIRLMPDNSPSVDIGLGNGAYTNANNYNLNAFARLNLKAATVGALATYWGLQLDVNAVNAAGVSTTTLQGDLLYTVDYAVVSGLNIYGTLTLLNVNGANGALTILQGTATTVYSGIRVTL